MTSIRDYVLHVTATALICAVIFHLSRGSGSIKMIIKLLCGIILACSIIQPIKHVDFLVMEEFVWEFKEEADRAVNDGKNASAAAWAESITQGTEAYILEEAKAMNANLIVEVELSEEEVPMPACVTLVGQVAPYTRSVLADMIEQNLNIPRERQIWISQ